MATATTAKAHSGGTIDWRNEWHEFEGVTYLNLASNSPIPKGAIKRLQEAIEWKRFPQRIPDAAFFEVPNRVRAAIAQLMGGKPEEVALTTGASTGMSAVAYGMKWQAGDEVITPSGEFPLQYATWKPMEEREGIKV